MVTKADGCGGKTVVGIRRAEGLEDRFERMNGGSAVAEDKPRVAVVDDDPAVLGSLARVLAFHGLAVTTFLSGESLLADIERLSPDCVVADLSMPGLTGFDLQRALAERDREYPIVFITGHGDIRASVQAMRGGAIDFLPKPFEKEELLDAVQRALARSRLARETDDRLDHVRRKLASLTQRERQVFDQVVAGFLNKQIAANLGISEKTVKVHRARVMRKMSVKSIAQLARVAEQAGIPSARA